MFSFVVWFNMCGDRSLFLFTRFSFSETSSKMNVQVADMISNTGISLHCLEKEFMFTESLQPSKHKPEY